jgi:polar amino acid transport system substrate-binding protein
LRIALCCFLFMLLPLLSFSSPTSVVRLVSGPDYAPLVNDQDATGGITTDLIRRALASQGYEIEVSFQPWMRGAQNTKRGFFDGTFPYAKSPTREEDFLFSEPFYTSPMRLFVRKDRHYKSSKEIRYKRICSPLGYDHSKLSEFMEKNHLSLVQPVNLEACFEMLHLGRIEGVPLLEHVGWNIIAKQDKYRDEFTTIESHVKDAKYFLMVGKSNPRAQEILKAFNKGLKSIRLAHGVQTLEKP